MSGRPAFPLRSAAVIAVGSEMLGSAKLDTNSLVIADRLAALGIELRAKSVVGDRRADLAALFRQALSMVDLVVLTGGLLGIAAMRVVIGQLLVVVRRYPTIVDGAFIIIAWVGIKLLLEFARSAGWIAFEVPKWLSLGLIVVIFLAAYLHARRKGPASGIDEDAEALLRNS